MSIETAAEGAGSGSSSAAAGPSSVTPCTTVCRFASNAAAKSASPNPAIPPPCTPLPPVPPISSSSESESEIGFIVYSNGVSGSSIFMYPPSGRSARFLAKFSSSLAKQPIQHGPSHAVPACNGVYNAPHHPRSAARHDCLADGLEDRANKICALRIEPLSHGLQISARLRLRMFGAKTV